MTLFYFIYSFFCYFQLGELNQSNQRLELSSNRVDDNQRRFDSRLQVIGNISQSIAFNF